MKTSLINKLDVVINWGDEIGELGVVGIDYLRNAFSKKCFNTYWLLIASEMSKTRQWDTVMRIVKSYQKANN